jgi:hypothetical protein
MKYRAYSVFFPSRLRSQEIVTAGMPLPAINQIPIHICKAFFLTAAPLSFPPLVLSRLPSTCADRSSSQNETIAWCKAHDVVVNSYSPLGVPDWRVDQSSFFLLFVQYA